MTVLAWRPRQAPARARVTATVLLVHLGLLAVWWRSAVDVQRPASRLDGPLMVWLHGGPGAGDADARADAGRIDAAPEPARRPSRPAARPAAPSPDTSTGPAPMAVPTAEATSGRETDPTSAVPAPAMPPAAAPVGKPLQLTLPRTALAASAPTPPGPGRPAVPWTVESRIAAALGSGSWIEERLDEDQVRFRQGERCVTLKRPRHTGIDPFNATMHPTPWISAGVQACGDGVARTRPR